MIRKTLNLQENLRGCLGCGEEYPLEEYALESFAQQVDDTIQKELLTRLILDHSSSARELEALNHNLRKSEAALKEAQQIAMLGRWDLDLKTGELIWSDSMFEILEIAPAVGPSIDGIRSRVHPEDGPLVQKLIEGMAAQKESWSVDYRLLMEDGRVKWIHLSHNPVRNGQGEVVQYYGTIQDISELKKNGVGTGTIQQASGRTGKRKSPGNFGFSAGHHLCPCQTFRIKGRRYRGSH